MNRILTKNTPNYLEKSVRVSGWVNTIRSHGKIIFFDLRDRSGLVQVVFTPNLKPEIYGLAQKVKPEWVIEITGKVSPRPKGMENPKIETGKIELRAQNLEILSQAKTLPFSIETPGYEVNEEKRLEYRYLDLRRPRLRKNLEMRQKVIQFMREFLIREEFLEIETPILTKSTPEGARDYLVPTRLQPGKFYALPQSPQQYKQLLMVSGIEKYFQIARCFRDEDPRANRQAEHTQLDIEISFVKQEEVMNLVESLFISLIKKIYPEKKIQKIPFPKITYQKAMEKYGTDRPDLRKDKTNPYFLAFCWVINFPFFKKDEKRRWTFTHNPFSAPKSEFMEDLLSRKNIKSILTTQYDIVANGLEVGGGSIRNHRPDALEAVFEIIGYEKEEIKNKFGHMLRAFEYGAPPHGGIASGIDRLLAVLQNEPNIREVIAFPKTGDSRDLMMDAPSKVSEKQLKELHLKILPR
ncbi:MAG: aspartate--tRNA ligase [Candidatus Nealsonbacteria bacterium CG_4_9_14_3_um_filter_35_11]|uniref:Aspartate--tRNA(Asp/Asn) ligase n=1 Tax=Candidatus Nealsonbacteria bacterium CG11_big_fil_rev_8_21_14_0_20_35_11 TaxID=1974713 RepID=A0A2H0N1L2_9BACT|nr:MAG: aspartate--tRNA ligase [Candidatus Nealsonbacteria bacterium CG11_big_fil_rev_8_21_14_0_20_35_11]PJA84522.1 MAG: aspartate--tRNA ligase [Candidatus Nealsonbacteria bacterium CG_4_9_14_3_um_filter_35_11]